MPDLLTMSAQDAGEILTLQRAAYATEAQIYGDPFLPALTQTLEDLRTELAGPALGFREDGRLVAAVRWSMDDTIGRIGRLTVAPDMQGRGLGTGLLRAAEDHIGADLVELFTGHLSEANLRLYRREGYRETRREPLHDGVDLVFLQKRRSGTD